MLQRRYSRTMADGNGSDQRAHQLNFAHSLRHLLVGVGVTLLLTFVEAILWMLNPTLFGGNVSVRTFAAFLSLPFQTPLLFIVPLGEFALTFWLALLAAQPLALRAYLKAVHRSQERYRMLYSPLQEGSYPYDMPIVYAQDNPDPTLPRRTSTLTMLELIETTLTEPMTHLILLGRPGSGKSMFLHEFLSAATQRHRRLSASQFKVPVFVSLKQYAFFCREQDRTAFMDVSLLDYLLSLSFPGMEHLHPYLGRLFQKGRLLFLCDGLDEVPEHFRPALDQELALLFRQDRNVLFLTCTQEIYDQSPELMQVIGENLVPRAVLQPLHLADMRAVVERFIGEQDSHYRPDQPTAGQLMTLIERTRLHLFCDTPFYLFALLEVSSVLPFADLEYLDTRGRLLRAFLLKRLQGSAHRAPEELAFLSDLACMARWNGDDDFLLIPGCSFLASKGDVALLPPLNSEQMDAFMFWLREQQVVFPLAQETVFLLAEMAEPDEAVEMLRRLQDAALIEVDEQGILHFRHALTTAAIVAAYLGRFLGVSALQDDVIETFPDDLAPWSEPLTLWAGGLEQPELAADILAAWARTHPEQRTNALLTSLICLGVAQTPPGVELQHPVTMPPALAEELKVLLSNRRWVTELATLFTRGVRHGSLELYQALFPLLAVEGIESWLVLLEPSEVSELFFRRLVEIIDDAGQEVQVKRLVRALSAWGSAVVPRAANLSSATSGAGGRLRTAAINVLGGTRARAAVEPLLKCLHDPDQIIVRRSANALMRLGPNLALQSLIEELETRATVNHRKPLHWIILPILERFLNESDAQRQLTPIQAERIIAALLHVQATHTELADVEKARAILVSHGKQAEERSSGRIAISLLVQNLATADDTVARGMTGALKAVGEVATPQLLEQLESQPSEAERVRILEILTSVRDLRALDALLRLLEDNSLAVQQSLATAMRVYAPECIPGLIKVVLHRSDDMVASRAEQILCSLGSAVVDPVTAALTPIVPDRTALLVHSLGHTRDVRAVPALLTLLPQAQNDVPLCLALAEALGCFADERAVDPLLEMLNSSNPLVAEGAINALSNLGELAYPALMTRLTVFEKTPLVARVERVVLGIQPFPGKLLLQTVDQGNEAQQRYIQEILLAGGVEAAQLLAYDLFHPRPRVRAYVRQVLGRMDARDAVPALLEVLSDPDPEWRQLIATLLLAHPREAVPPLVGLLNDSERAEAAVEILLRSGPAVLPALIPALDAQTGPAHERACFILVTMVQRQQELLVDTVQLFGLTPLQQARETLIGLLSEELAEISLPALMAGLEDAHLIRDVVETLVRQAQRNSALQATVLAELLQALRVKSRRAGATQALIELSSAAVSGVGTLITDPDPQVARVARYILGEIGIPAFAFIWAAHSDSSAPDRREAAREVFRSMPTSVIKDELVTLLIGARQEEISMALSLLLERIHDEESQPGHAREMLPSLLEYVQTSSDERASLRILALFILLGGPLVAQALVDALYADAQGHERLVQTFLLLGQGVENDLLTILRDGNAPTQLQAEVVGIMAMRGPHREALDRALKLNEHGLWAGRAAQKATSVLQPSQLAVSLRALGGLLVGGHWDVQELQKLRTGYPQGGPERELVDTLLGWRYSPQLNRLRQELETEREERKNELLLHTEELLGMKAQMLDVEQDLQDLQKKQQEQSLDQEQRRKDYEEAIALLNKEKQALQIELQKMQQEKQSHMIRLQQAGQEKEKLQAELLRWQTYAQKLEMENSSLRRPPTGA